MKLVPIIKISIMKRKTMVFQLIVLIIIPIILAIVTYPIFEEPHEEEQIETITPEYDSKIQLLFFTLAAIWILFLLRILYLAKKGNFKSGIKQW